MGLLTDKQDAYGHLMLDYFNGIYGYEIGERDDGLFEVYWGPRVYFSEYKDWLELDRKGVKQVKGRVLDIGCGAGRHALYLQQKGFDVVGIDNSPLGIEVCKKRGLKNAIAMSIDQLSKSKLGKFDTVLMLGNAFGLFQNCKKAKKMLKQFHKLISPNGIIIAQSLSPYDSSQTSSDNLEYYENNRKNGRMAGQIRLRIRYRKYATPWHDFLFVSKDEMSEILIDTNWRVRKFEDGDRWGMYNAILEKES